MVKKRLKSVKKNQDASGAWFWDHSVLAERLAPKRTCIILKKEKECARLPPILEKLCIVLANLVQHVKIDYESGI